MGGETAAVFGGGALRPACCPSWASGLAERTVKGRGMRLG
jgi:hypothetical protein